jgi:integrase
MGGKTGHRGHGEGTLYENKKRGRWVAQVTLPDGRRKARSGKTRQEAQKLLRQMQREIEAGLHGSRDGEQTLREFARAWLDNRTLRLTTRVSYESIYRLHVAPRGKDGIGDLKLTRVTPKALHDFYAHKRAGGLSSTSVHHIHAFIHVVLNSARKLGILPSNPADLAEAPPIRTKPMQPLSREQLPAFLAALGGTRDEALHSLALGTGLREAEILGLRWSDVDSQRHELRVRQGMKRLLRAFHITEPKSRTSVRTLPIPDYAWERLQQWRSRQAAEQALIGTGGDAWDNPHGIIFTTNTGRPRHPSTVRATLRKALARAGLPVAIRFHDLRHTFATLMLEDGVHIKVVSELLGHASVNVTLMIYAHVTPRMRDRALISQNAIFAGAVGDSPAVSQTPTDYSEFF